ncbi:MAG: hypothetical protein U0521_28405 [Anaerolineae bacterium]
MTSNGSCGTDFILVINPPPVVQDQAAFVAPTAAPPVQPTQPPPPPQPSGACLLTVVGDQLIFTPRRTPSRITSTIRHTPALS